MKKTFLAAVILGIFVFTLSSDFFSSEALMPDVLAELREVTHLNIERGAVLVNGEAVVNGVVLKEGDSVEVQSGASASIVFFDNSISRLSSGTKVIITEITGGDSDSAESHVKLKLDFGEAWSKVIKLVNKESTFSVATADVAATVRGSAFNIAVNETGDTVVMAVEHSLLLEKIKTADHQKDESVVVLEGQKVSSYPRVRRAVASDVESQPIEIAEQPSAIRFKVEKIAKEEKEDSWFRDNRKSDKIHEFKVQRKIEKAQEKMVGSLPGSATYIAKTIRDKVLLATAFDVEKRAEIETKIAERKILEAQVLMRNGDEATAEEQLKEAEELLLQVTETRDESTDSRVKANLDEKIAGTVSNSKKMADPTTVSNRDYRVKEFLHEVEVAVASEDAKEEIKKEQYQRKIIETYDLAKLEDDESVNELLEKLAGEIKNDFTTADAEKDISEESLNDLIADPYLDAVMRKVSIIKEKHASAETEGEEAEEKEAIKLEEKKEKEEKKTEEKEEAEEEAEEKEEIKLEKEEEKEEKEEKKAEEKEEKKEEKEVGDGGINATDWLMLQVKNVVIEEIQAESHSEENEESYFFEADDIDGQIEIEDKPDEASLMSVLEIQQRAEAELEEEARLKAEREKIEKTVEKLKEQKEKLQQEKELMQQKAVEEELRKKIELEEQHKAEEERLRAEEELKKQDLTKKMEEKLQQEKELMRQKAAEEELREKVELEARREIEGKERLRVEEELKNL